MRIEHGLRMRLPILGEAEAIGKPECPLIWRWTLIGEDKTAGDSHWWRKMPVKVMLHYFTPNTEDLDWHDHPRSFFTFVFKGEYTDINLKERSDHLSAPALRFRSAEHAHRTITGKAGAWTLIVMGPLKRPWGFWLDGSWIPWRKYDGTKRICE
jgi:hypothetical protein